jgi:L-ascorbate metabolism protein UlaG (beta-lactamase superfamily)
VNIRIIRLATVLVETQSLTILIDPFFMPWSVGIGFPPPAMTVEALPTCHLILCTHPHIDHFDLTPVVKRWSDVPVVVPQGVEKQARRRGAAVVISPAMWETYTHHQITITPVPAVHGGTAQGYVLQTATGQTIYLAGDTRYHADMAEISKRFPEIDVALMHVEGLSFFGKMVNMDPNEALSATRLLRPRIVVPYHRDVQFHLPIGTYAGALDEYVAIVQEANLPTEVRILGVGEVLHVEE